ncbi:hypothetical protein [Pantoea ananatis]|uniref:hypothetical protein n=1 Tax=Pantoea ananas TaxID=553 RepID=UPI00067E5065|nr:hypothetical protein [Pantoea ananatis]
MNRLFYPVLGFIGLRKLIGKDRKSAGEWGFLVNILFIVQLIFMEQPGVIDSAVLQLLWAAIGTRSAFQATETWKKTGRNLDPASDRFVKMHA